MRLPRWFRKDTWINHLVCCDPNLGLCGEDLLDAVPIHDGEDSGHELCESCRTLAASFEYQCPKCGCRPDELCGQEVSF